MEKEGTGLGLAISKKIILEHGGSVHCESNKGMTTFLIRLPVIAPGEMKPKGIEPRKRGRS